MRQWEKRRRGFCSFLYLSLVRRRATGILWIKLEGAEVLGAFPLFFFHFLFAFFSVFTLSHLSFSRCF